LAVAAGGAGTALATRPHHDSPRPDGSYSAPLNPINPNDGAPAPASSPQTELDAQREKEIQPLAKAQADKLAAQLNQSHGQGSFRVHMFAGTIIRPTSDGRQEHISHPLVFGDPNDHALAHQWFGIQATHDGRLSFNLIPYDAKPEDKVVYLEDQPAQASGNPYMDADVYLDNGAGRDVPPEQLPQMWGTDAQGQEFVTMPAATHITQ
jgi:hypothetical protein